MHLVGRKMAMRTSRKSFCLGEASEFRFLETIINDMSASGLLTWNAGAI